MADKVRGGLPEEHNCGRELPWPPGCRETGTEPGAVWKCSCGRYWRVSLDRTFTKWQEVNEHGELLRRSILDAFLDLWR